MDWDVAEDGEAIQMMNTISPLKLKGSLTNSQFFSVFFSEKHVLGKNTLYQR